MKENRNAIVKADVEKSMTSFPLCTKRIKRSAIVTGEPMEYIPRR